MLRVREARSWYMILLFLCAVAVLIFGCYPYIIKQLSNTFIAPEDTSRIASHDSSAGSSPITPRQSPLSEPIRLPNSGHETGNDQKPKKDKFLVVSAISSNHYNEEQDMIATAQHFFPNSRIIIYDIGLKQTEINTLKKYCNVEVRTFPFDKYPPHVKNLHTYAWKPLIIQAAAQEADFIFWADSSVRFVKNFDDTFSKLDDFPIKGHLHPICKIVHVTHDATLKYLNVTREMLGQVVGIEAGIMLIKTNEVAMHVLNLWRSCALEVSCIAPEGSRVSPCDYGKGKPTTIAYIGCHRFDQSALNSILIRDYGKEVFTKILNSVVNKMKVIHAPTSTFKIKHCV